MAPEETTSAAAGPSSAPASSSAACLRHMTVIRSLRVGMLYQVHFVVRRLQVPILHQQVNGDESSEGPRANKGIVIPAPLSDRFMARQFCSKSPCWLFARIAFGQLPTLHVIRRGLMESECP